MIVDQVGIKDFDKYIVESKDKALEAANMSINRAATYGKALIKRRMLRDINLTSSYIDSKLRVRKAASGGSEASIIGTHRNISLYRFVTGSVKGRELRVGVKPGNSVLMKRSFAIKLRNGNFGFAQRVKDKNATSHSGSRKAKMISPGLFLLYSTSVHQHMKSTLERDDTIQRDIRDELGVEFKRQFRRLNRGR